MAANVGHELRRARQAKDLTLEKVAGDTHIRIHYLQALESGNMDVLPSEAQARGFLRSYASYLGLKPNPLIASLKGQTEIFPQASKPEPGASPGIARQETSNANAIFAQIGQTLQKQRELLGFSLLDVERQTHVRAHYLQALESGTFDRLPSPVQGRGMLHNYAAFLGIDPDGLLLKYAEGLQTRHKARKGETTKRHHRRREVLPSSLRRLISGDLVFGGTLIISLLVFVLWSATRIASIQTSQGPPATAPAIVDVLLPSATLSTTGTATFAIPTSSPGTAATSNDQLADGPEGSPTSDVTPPDFSEGAVHVHIVAHQRAYLRVVVDNKVEFNGRVIPGNAYTFSGRDQVEISTGSGSALQVIYNRQDLGTLGIFGEVVHHVYTINGVLTPTATITRTPIVTQTDSPTPTQTPTITETVTTSPTLEEAP